MLLDLYNDLLFSIKSFLFFHERYQLIQTCKRINLGITSLSHKKYIIKRPYIEYQQLKYEICHILYVNPFSSNISVPFFAHLSRYMDYAGLHIIIYDTKESYYNIRIFRHCYQETKEIDEYLKTEKYECKKFKIDLYRLIS